MIEKRLEIIGLTSGYGGSAVVRNIDLTVASGEIVALLGANGAGKTTTLRTVSGILQPLAGSVRIEGRDVVGESPQRRARRGLGHVLEGRGVFSSLTVGEHLRVGPSVSRAEEARVFEYFPVLAHLRDRPAGLLSGGEQQMLALASALARRPRLLLVDELSLGLAPVIVEQLLPIIRRCADETGAGVLIVEQHTNLALEVADRGVVLAHGEVVLDAPAARLRADRDLLVASYLGGVERAVQMAPADVRPSASPPPLLPPAAPLPPPPAQPPGRLLADISPNTKPIRGAS